MPESQKKSSFVYLFLLYFLIIFFAHIENASAQGFCYKDGAMKSSGWKMLPPGSSFSNGQVIGSTTAHVSYKMQGLQTHPMITAGSPAAQDNQYDAIPMPQTPGIGVRIKWLGYGTTVNITVKSQVPYGTILSKKYWKEIFDATYRSSYIINFFYGYEIVVIDKDKYKGGKLVITDSTDVTAITTSRMVGQSPQVCLEGFVNLLTAVVSELNIPELPEPSKPTCASAEISFHKKMNAINASQVAPYASSRSSGTTEELLFRLIGKGCSKNTVIKAYFTDARSPSASSNYLSSTNQAVGIRLYYDQDQTPINFGPAPIGSTLPSRQPITTGPATIDMETLYIPVTAQYVRYPGVAAGDVKAGEMQAATTITFVYD